jgi:hypothetical protein
MKGTEAASAIKGMMPQVPRVLFTLYGEAITSSLDNHFQQLYRSHVEWPGAIAGAQPSKNRT